MTTDITELAQREKFEAWAEEVGALPWGILKKHRNQDGSYPGPHYTYMWKAWQAASAELVEALELKEEQRAQPCEHSMFWDASGVKRCSKCDLPEHANVHYADAAEMEIAAVRQRIAELEPFRTAYMEWSDKTDWVQTDKRFDVLKPWGMHRADVLKAYIEHLESRTVTIEPFRSFVTDADLAALHRFAECCDDPESGGHDLEKEQVRRLEAIGALQRSGQISYITGFGDVLISITAGIKVEADIVDADVSDRNQPGMVVAVHIDAGDFVKFRGQVYEVRETGFDDHDVTLWFVGGETLQCAAGCQIEVVSAPVEVE